MKLLFNVIILRIASCVFLMLLIATSSFSQVIENRKLRDVPVIICQTDTLVFTAIDSCSAYVSISQPEVISNCGEYQLTNDYTGTNNASSIYPVGATTIEWTVTDTCGTASCMQLVVMVDTIPPVIECPDDIVGLAGPDSCWAFVVVPQPGVYDNCAVDSIWNDYTLTDDASDIYSIGITEVWWYAIGIYGNIDSCMMAVVVADTTPPMIICPDDIVQLADPDSSSAYVVVPEPVVFDNCWADSIWNDYTGTGNASEYFPIGETLITWYALDVFGNLDSCDMTIQVTDNYAIDEKEIASFVIFPNPTGGIFTISYTIPENEAINLKIIELTGQVVYSNKNLNALSGQENQIDVTGLKKGIYIIRLETVSGIVTKKVTVI